MKTCNKCGEEKGLSEFSKDASRKSGVQSHCKKCHCAHERVWRLKKEYNSSIEEYENLLQEQGGVCRICGGTDQERRLSVDHDHSTGEIRGLLCKNCNAGLGRFYDDPGLLEKAADYLRVSNLVAKREETNA